MISEDLLKVALAVFGGMSGRKVNKFRIAREKYGVRVSKAKKIRALVLPEAPLILECKLHSYHIIGDHYLIVGDPIEVYGDLKKEPLVYFMGEGS